MTSLVFALTLAIAAPVPGDKKSDDEFQKKLDAARTKAIKYLKEKQSKDGDWEDFVLNVVGGQKGGPTALAALALLEAGVPANDTTITKAVEFLLKLEPERTYVVSLQTQECSRGADAKKYAKEIQANVDWLMEKAIYKNGKLTGVELPDETRSPTTPTPTSRSWDCTLAAASRGEGGRRNLGADLATSSPPHRRKNGAGRTRALASRDTPPQHDGRRGCRTWRSRSGIDKKAKGPDPAFEKGMEALLGGKLGEFGDGKSWFYSWIVSRPARTRSRLLALTEFKSGKLTKAWYRAVPCGGDREGSTRRRVAGSTRETAPTVDMKWPIVTTACPGCTSSGPPKK